MYKLIFRFVIFCFIAGPVLGILQVKTNDKDFEVGPSCGLAPLPKRCKEAVVQVYGIQSPSWRGAISIHTYIAYKPKYGTEWFRCELLESNQGRELVLHHEHGTPDGMRGERSPFIVHEIRGIQAERVIGKLRSAISLYPHMAEYDEWFGPNDNTFIAYLGRAIPSFKMVLPHNAIGKDYYEGSYFNVAPSHTGFQCGYKGIISATLAKEEGIEISFAGLALGINVKKGVIKLPGLNEISYMKSNSE